MLFDINLFKMEFTNKVQQSFREAGWFPGRNVSCKYKDVNKINEFPKSLKDFLFEYGNLIALDAKRYESEVINKLLITLDYAEFEDEKDYQYYYELFGKTIYPFAKFDEDGYRIACDNEGKVYMIGDYYFIIGNNLQEGVENLIMDNWEDVLEFDEAEKKWIKKNI